MPNDTPAGPIVPPPSGPPTGPGGKSIAALILGILSLIPCCLFLTGIPAIVLGRMELADIRAGQSHDSGETMARVGYVLGIIGSIFGCVIVVMWGLLVALGVIIDGL
jgi:hypothetical protein